MKVEFDYDDFARIMDCIDVAGNLIYETKEHFDNLTIGAIKTNIDFIAREIDKASFRLYNKGAK